MVSRGVFVAVLLSLMLLFPLLLQQPVDHVANHAHQPAPRRSSRTATEIHAPIERRPIPLRPAAIPGLAPPPQVLDVLLVRVGRIPRVVVVQRVLVLSFSRGIGFLSLLLLSGIVAALDDLDELRLAFRALQAVLVAVPFVLALVAVDDFALRRGGHGGWVCMCLSLICGCA